MISEDILDHLRARTYILAEVGEGIFGFVHRTFMEYFVAAFCQAEFNRKESDFDWLTKEIFGKHWHRDEWQEVLLLLIAMLAGQGTPIRKVIDYLWRKPRPNTPLNVAFAAHCLAESLASTAAEGGRVEDETWAKSLVDQLANNIAYYAPRANSQVNIIVTNQSLTAFSMLAPMIGQSTRTNKVIERLQRSTKIRERMAAWQMGLALRSRQERLEYSLVALRDAEEAVRRGAIAALEREWAGNSEAEQALVDVIRIDRYIRVRQAAIEALQRAWPENEKILEAIAFRIDQETSYTFAEWIIRYLARAWKNHESSVEIVVQLGRHMQKIGYVPFTENIIPTISALWRGNKTVFALLQDWAVNALQSRVRQAAVAAIGSWQGEDALAILHDRIINDPAPSVRQQATIYAIGLPFSEIFRIYGNVADRDLTIAWQGDADALKLLLSQVSRDPDPFVRRVAVDLVGLGWQHDNIALPFVREWIDSNPDISLRVAAVNTLKNWDSNVDALGILSDVLSNSSSQDLRSSAVQALSAWVDNPSALLLLCQTVESDINPTVRKSAVLAPSYAWNDNSTAIDMLWRCSTDDPSEIVRALAISQLARFEWGQDNRKRIIRLLNDQNDARRIAVGGGLGAFWDGDTSLLQTLWSIVKSSEDSDLSTAIIAGLSTSRIVTSDIIDSFCDLAKNSPYSEVKKGLFAALGLIYSQVRRQGEATKVEAFLEEYLTFEKDPKFLNFAIEVAGAYLSHDSPSLSLVLEQIASKSKNSGLRYSAIRAISRRSWEHYELLYLLAENDTDTMVRAAAIQGLGGHWRWITNGFVLLRDMVLNQQVLSIREASARALQCYLSTDQRAASLLEELANNMEQQTLQRIAIEVLCSRYNWREAILPRLYAEALQESDEDIRSNILLSINEQTSSIQGLVRNLESRFASSYEMDKANSEQSIDQLYIWLQEILQSITISTIA